MDVIRYEITGMIFAVGAYGYLAVKKQLAGTFPIALGILAPDRGSRGPGIRPF